MATRKQVKVETGKIAWRFEQPAKPVSYKEADAKYVGNEPQYPSLDEQDTWSHVTYRTTIHKTLNWYNFTQDNKTSQEWLVNFLSKNPRRAKQVEAIKRGELTPGSSIGFVLRAARMGLKLRFSTMRTIVKALKTQGWTSELSPKEVKEVKVEVSKPNIQDRLREKAQESAGDLEGAFDDFVKNGFKGEPRLVDLLTKNNIQPAHVKHVVAVIERNIAEFEQVAEGKDSQLLEAYKHWNKRQIKAVLAWWQQALADTNSYGIIKRANKAPRKKKAVPPEKVVAKLIYMRESTELKVKSVDPVNILSAEELWVYNTKTRKLGIYIADSHIGKLGVKGSKIFGFDSALSVQKTLRKPDKQIKEFNDNGKPAAKKWFKGIKSTEIKLNGRISQDTILLKVYK